MPKMDNSPLDVADCCCKCEVELDPESKCIQCERCCQCYCIGCANVDEATYKCVVQLRFLHWYCAACEELAVKAVQSDNLIEERCQEILSKVEHRLKSCESILDKKADSAKVNHLVDKVNNLEKTVEDLVAKNKELTKKLNLVRFEPFERAKRAKNVVIRGIPESGSVEQDKIVVSMALAEVGCADVEPIEVSRIGESITDNQNVTASSASAANHKHSNVSRPIRCALTSLEDKSKVLQNAKKIRHSKLDYYDSKKVFIVPDRTALQRADDLELRNKLKLKREQFPNKHFVINRRNVVEVDPRTRPQDIPQRFTRLGSRTYWSQHN